MAQTARLSAKSDSLIKEIVAITGKCKTDVLESALECYRHYEKMRLFNKGYRRLKSKKRTWQEEQEERESLEGTLMDGLED